MMTDPIADMLTRIRNALMTRHAEVILPYSHLKFAVAKILEQEQFVVRVEHIVNNGTRRRGQFVPDQLRITLKYAQEGVPAITRIGRISRPGNRVYCAYRDLPKVQDDFGIAIVSTPRGVMTNHAAKQQKVGGEILCEVW